MLDIEICHAAVEAKDRRFDGRFYVGVKSTGVYCRCICPARTPKRENRSFHLSAAAAEAAGFRPCLICRPELAPGHAPIEAPARLAVQAYARIEAGALEERGLETLARELGVTDRHLRRVMNAQFGASPIDIAQTARLLTAKRLLAETKLSVTSIAFASGFRSLRRFNATVKDRYGLSPSSLRGRRAHPDRGAMTLTLGARGALDLAPTCAFLALRALPGVELGGPGRYARTLRIGESLGWIDAKATVKGLALTISDSLAPSLRPLIASARGAFDLDADMSAVDAHLARDERFAQAIEQEPGVRMPGALDGFELASRAVLGQQVTVAGARTLTERLVAAFGEDVAGAPGGLSRAFPRAARLADASAASIAKIGLPGRRAETLHRLALASADGKLPLHRGAIAAGRAALSAMPGVGPWTVEYVALRALGDPDAFPASDAAIVGVLGSRDELEELRPWRAYAAVRLWRRAAQRKDMKGPKP
jgi:AraC family transcriptional regulator of adaptative response / DNA-3-methyladenine glycosylase II